MEFFRTADVQINQDEIQKKINFESISEIYPDMIVLGGDEKCSEIGSFWGEFLLQRDEIMGGVRFSMLNCPNALAWSITTGYPPERNKLIIHLTINRLQKPKEFVSEINELLDGWKTGLEDFFSSPKQA